MSRLSTRALFVVLNLIAGVNLRAQSVDINVQGLSPAARAAAVDVVGSVVSSAHLAAVVLKMQNTVLAASMNLECSVYGENNLCASVGARYTQIQGGGQGDFSFSGATQTGMTLQLGLRLNPRWQLGAFFDQGISVSGLDTYDLKSPQPLAGMYAAYSPSGTSQGWRFKMSAAYASNSVGLTATATTAPNGDSARGQSRIAMQGVQFDASYLFALNGELGLVPFAGMRNTRVSFGGYGSTTPRGLNVDYDSMSTDIATGFGGLRIVGAITPQLSFGLSAGLEQVLQSRVDNFGFSARPFGSFSVPAASAAATSGFVFAVLHYAFEKNQRISLNVFYSQQSLDLPSGLTTQIRYSFGF